MKKIYCFNNGGSTGWYGAMAMAQDGTVLAKHVCSHPCFMKHDLGMESDWKHENYNAHYGEGNWELEWVEDPHAHPGLQAAYKKNQKLKPAPKCNNPSVTMQFSDGTTVKKEF